MNWTLEQLRAFVTAAEKGSFSAAGRALGRAQSVVSTHISMLEDSLGIELFDLDLTGGQVDAGKFFVVCVCHNDNLQKSLYIFA